MAVIKGYTGAVKVGSTPTSVGEVQSFTIDLTADVVETTALGNTGWKTNISSLKSWGTTITANFDYGDAGQTIITVGDTVAVELYVGGTEVGNKKYSGSIIIASVPISNDVGGLTTVTFNGTGNGELTAETIA